MNDEILNNYNRLITSSQETMRDVITIINHQESTLRRLINRDYDDTANTINTLRRENQELRRRLNSQGPTPRLNIPTPITNPAWTHREIRPPLQSNEPIGVNRNTRQTNRNPNITVLPNNQDQYMRRYLTNIPDLIFGTIGQELTPVVVRPSDRQVREATQLVRFGNIIDPQNSNCPISLERFVEQQLVTRIIFCGHIFSTNELQTWFETNVRCPLCRFDIREHRNQASRNNLSTVIENNEPLNDTFNQPEPMPEIISEPNPEPNPEPIPEPIPEPEIEQTYENDIEQEEELFNSISRNVDNLLRDSEDLSSNLSDELVRSVRSITGNLQSLTPINHINITPSDIFGIFNNDISFNMVNNRMEFINRYSNTQDISSNLV